MRFSVEPTSGFWEVRAVPGSGNQREGDVVKRKVALALCVALWVCASSAQAATISFMDSYGPTAVPSGAAPLATLSQFDPSLGTLTKVTLTLDADASAGSIAWDNEAAIPTDVTLGIGAEVTALGLAGLSVIAIPLQIGSALGVAADNDGAADFVGTDSFTVNGGVGNDLQSNELLAGMGAYIGLGTFDTTLSSVVENFLSTTGGFGPIQQTPGVTSGTVTVTYEYTLIPEPTTALLLGLGLLGLAARARR
jgi:hypothetical protein